MSWTLFWQIVILLVLGTLSGSILIQAYWNSKFNR